MSSVLTAADSLLAASLIRRWAMSCSCDCILSCCSTSWSWLVKSSAFFLHFLCVRLFEWLPCVQLLMQFSAFHSPSNSSTLSKHGTLCVTGTAVGPPCSQRVSLTSLKSLYGCFIQWHSVFTLKSCVYREPTLCHSISMHNWKTIRKQQAVLFWCCWPFGIWLVESFK